MNTLNQMRQQLHETWGNLAEGWRALMARAGQALTRFSPARSADALETAEERIALQAPRWGLLAAEVRDEPQRVVVRIEAPGMSEEDFDIEVHKDALVVRGEKRVQREESQGDFFVMECAYGSFERAIALPAVVDDERAKATYRRGVLRIELAKRAAARVRRVRVDSV